MKKIIALCLVVSQIMVASSNQNTDAIQRLGRHVRFLEKINRQFKKPIIKVDAPPLLCKHELIRWCIQKMHDERQIDVVFDVWGAFTAHTIESCTEDCVFVHDFAALMYVIYMNIITLATRLPVQDFVSLYAQVAELPIDELLNLLDIFYERLGVILDAYMHNGSLTTTLQDYWWVPVAVVAAFSTRLFIWYALQTHHQR